MKIKSVLIVLVILAALSGLAWFQFANRPVRMNNEVCPYSKNPVNDKDTYIHNGKEYRLCDEKCKKPLSENPGKYLCD
jgi:YHS domain-containing protein